MKASLVEETKLENAEKWNAGLSIFDIRKFRDDFARLLGAQPITEKWDLVVACFGEYGGADDDEGMFYNLQSIEFRQQGIKNILAKHNKYTDLILVAIARAGTPKPTPYEAVILGQILAYARCEQIDLQTGNSSVQDVELFDFIVVGEGGEWRSVPAYMGLNEKHFCPDCLKYNFESSPDEWPVLIRDGRDGRAERMDEWGLHRYWCPRFVDMREESETLMRKQR